MHMPCITRAPIRHTPGQICRGGLVALFMWVGGAAVATAQDDTAKKGDIRLPSGESVIFNDVIWGEPGPAGLTVRFRFLDPDLARRLDTEDFMALEQDTAFLCDTYALERIASTGPQPQQIVISISDREVAFGEPAPEAAQVFEAYSFDGSGCTWERF